MSDVLTRLAPALSDRYRIEREVGAGGMATVYLAHDIKHGRDVALKVLRPDLAAVLGAERFLNEISISAKLDHPHILTLIDSGEADGFLYYVMPFVRGESLRTRLNREKQLGVDEALTITRHVGSALEYAHRQGVVHRDIKPENILIHEGEATLADFGIAMAVKEAGGNRLTQTGLSLGTPQYMSPEQATGDRTLDARSDVYSLAAVLYEMLAGEPPHSGATVQAIIAKLMTERPTRLRVMRDTVPEGIDNAVAKALAKVPADRYANAGEFTRALATVPQQVQPKKTTNWLPFAAAGAVAVIAVAALLMVNRRPPPAAPVPDRVQMTTTGNSFVPALSPDGNRLAFAEKKCGAEGACTWQLVIQDIDGTGRLVVTAGISGVGDIQWTADARYLVYDGSYGATRWGAFAVSSLGGSPRFLGCCAGSVLAGDTVAIIPQSRHGDTLLVMRLVTLRDGQPRDSLVVHNPGIRAFAWPTDDPDKLLLMTQAVNLAPVQLRLVDRRGNVLSRSSEGMDMRGRDWTSAPLRGRGAMLFGVQRERGAGEYDFFRIAIAGNRIAPGIDTVMRGIDLSMPGIDVGSDASRMAYSSGPFEASVISFEALPHAIGPVTELLTSTTRVWGRVSPDGRRVAFVRQTTAGAKARFQIWLMPLSGGESVQLTGPLEGLVDFEWNPDGSGLIYLSTVSDTQRVVVAVDTTGSKTRALGRFGPDIAGGVQVLPDNRFILAAAEGTRITLFGQDGKQQAVWTPPSWVALLDRFSASPDGKSVAMMGWDRNYDSTVVARVDVATGVFTRLAAAGGEGYGRIKWVSGGDLMFDIMESRGVRTLYRMKPDERRMMAVANLPRTSGSYTIAADGKRIVAFTQNEKSDVYVIRNLGEILKYSER